MKKLLLSIVIPAYNADKYIERCVKSIVKAGDQYRGDFEIIIVNDGSVDDTLAVCQELKSVYGEIVIVDNDNGGVSLARNTGIEYARGNYITFCDSDDEFKESYFSAVKPELDLKESDILAFGYCTYHANDNIKKNSIANKIKYSNDEFIREMLSSDAIGGFVWNKIFKKQLISENRFNKDIGICEDLSFVFSVLCKNENLLIKYIPVSLYVYYNNEYSVSRRLTNLFEEGGSFKYSNTFNEILQSGGLDYEAYLKSKNFECALGVMLDNVIKKKLSNAQMAILRQELKRNYIYFLKNADVAWKTKLRLIMFYFFPVLKQITNKS